LAGSITIPSPGEPWLPSALFIMGAVLFLGLAMLDVGCAEATILDSLRRVATEKAAVFMGEREGSESFSGGGGGPVHQVPSYAERPGAGGPLLGAVGSALVESTTPRRSRRPRKSP